MKKDLASIAPRARFVGLLALYPAVLLAFCLSHAGGPERRPDPAGPSDGSPAVDLAMRHTIPPALPVTASVRAGYLTYRPDTTIDRTAATSGEWRRPMTDRPGSIEYFSTLGSVDGHSNIVRENVGGPGRTF